MTDRTASFERDRDIARERYPMEMERLETLRAGFDLDFPAALRHARGEEHLIRWRNGTHILAYDPGLSPVGFCVRIDADRQQVTDVGMVGQLFCPSFVEVCYEREAPAPTAPTSADPRPRPRADCQQERAQPTKPPIGYFEPDSYQGGRGNYHGDPPKPPAGAIVLPRDPARCRFEAWWEREKTLCR